MAMRYYDTTGAVDQELRASYKKREEDYGICPDCQTCHEPCKQVMAEGLTMFWCLFAPKSNVVDKEE